MSFVTGTVTELLYASTTPSAAKNTFTTEAQLNTTASMGVQAHLPPDFWLPNQNQLGRGIRVVARGLLGTTTSAPNYTFNLRGGAAGNITTNPLLAGTGAVAMAVSLTNAAWEWSCDLMLSAIGAAGANSTLQGQGMFFIGGVSGAPYPVVAGGTVPTTTVATLDTSITNYLNFNVASSVSNAANTITLNQLLVFGLN